MNSALTSNLVAGLLIVGALVGVRARLRAGAAQRPQGPAAELLRVGGQVISQHRLTLRWTLRYPLPDGRPHEFEVPRTRPEKLTEGMPVIVLVDPADPRRARLDVPPRAQVLRRLRLILLLFLGAVLLVAEPVAAFIFSLG